MCPDCAARRQKIRDAWLQRNIRGTATEVAKGVAEVVGLKKKTGVAEQRTAKTSAKRKAAPKTARPGKTQE